MNALSVSALADLAQLWPWWVGSMLKATVWLGAWLLMERAWQRRSSSLRHVVAVLAAFGLPVIFVVNLSPRPERYGWQPLAPVWERVAGPDWPAETTVRPEDRETAHSPPPRVYDPKPHRRFWPGVVMALWGAGVLSCWLGLVVRSWPRRVSGRSADLASDVKVVQAVERECARLAMKRCPRLRLVAYGVPRLTGLWRPILELPEAAQDWTEEKLSAVFRHELAHLRRSDLRWMVATEAALALVWGHPLRGVLRRRLARLREEACDDAVIASGMEASVYAAHLASFLTGSGPMSRAWSLPAVQPNGWPGRFRRMLDPEVSRRVLRAWEIVGVSVLAGAVVLAATLSVGCAAGRGPVLMPTSLLSRPPQLPDVKSGEPGYYVAVRFLERLVPNDGALALGFPEEFQSINGMILTQQEGWKLFNPDDPSVDSVFWFGGGSMVSRTMTMVVYRAWTEGRAEWQWGPGKLDLPSYAPVQEIVSAAKRRPTGFVCGMGLAPPTVVGKFDVMLDVECKILVGMTADPKTGQQRPVINRQSLKGTWSIENGSYILLGVRKEPKPVEVFVPGLRRLPLVGRIFRESRHDGFLRIAAVQIMVAEHKDSGKLVSSQFNIPE